jgi:hypothetical protein
VGDLGARGRRKFFGKGLDRGISRWTVAIHQAFDRRCSDHKAFEAVETFSQIQLPPRHAKSDLPTDDFPLVQNVPLRIKKNPGDKFGHVNTLPASA